MILITILQKMDENKEDAEKTIRICRKCNRLELGNREVFDKRKHCSCQIPDTHLDMLKTGAMYIEHSVILADEDDLSNTVNKTMRDGQLYKTQVDIHAMAGLTPEHEEEFEDRDPIMLSEVNTEMLRGSQHLDREPMDSENNFTDNRRYRERMNPKHNNEEAPSTMNSDAETGENEGSGSKPSLEMDMATISKKQVDQREFGISLAIPVLEEEFSRQKTEYNQFAEHLEHCIENW